MNKKSDLIVNMDKLHTTEMGRERIRRNLNINDDDVVAWCRRRILDEKSVSSRQGKNWYVDAADCRITINAGSYTIITAHRRGKQ